MYWNFFRIAIVQAFRCKEQTIIKILGLAVGIAICLFIFLIVRFESSFDNFHPNRNHIYRVVSVFKTPEGIDYETGVPFPTAPTLRHDYPQLKQVASILSLGGDGQITITSTNKMFREKSGVLYAEPQFFEMFGFKWLSGEKATALNEPNTVILTRSIADKYFGSWTSAIGKSLKLDNALLLKVTGVLEDMPANTDFPLKVVLSYATLHNTGIKGRLDNWVSVFAQHYCFVTLPDQLSETKFNKDLTDMVNRYKPAENRNEGMMLLPLKNMHFDSRFNTFNNHPFSQSLINALSLIGLFVLFIACMNFVNLSTAQAVNRSIEVGVRKVLGGTRSQLLLQFMAETVLIVLVATLVAGVLCKLTVPVFERILELNLGNSFTMDPALIGLLFVIVTGTSFLGGFYPALVLSRFDPILAFKNRAAPRAGGSNLLRRVLVVIQFTISQALIICVLIIVGQVDYFRSAPMGFNKNAVLITHMPDNKKMDYLRQRLLHQTGVENVSFSFASPNDVSSDWNTDISYNGKRIHDFGVNLKWADSVYTHLYGMNLLAGRFIGGGDDVIVNEAFLRKLGIRRPEDALGASLGVVGVNDSDGYITGVVKDFNIASLHDTIRPVLIQEWKEVYSTVNIKLSASMLSQSLPAIEKLWKSTFPENVYEYQFLDETIAHYYEQETRLALMYKLFAGLAIFISCLGLYSLVSFMAASRTKEVGIRKTLGASVLNIVNMFSREFMFLVFLAFLIAAPIAGFFMFHWLQNYAFHFQPGPMIFIEASGLSALIACTSVGYRALKAATANPVTSLRSE